MKRQPHQADPAEDERLREIGALLGMAYLRLLIQTQEAALNPHIRLDGVAAVSPSCAGVKHHHQDEGAA